MQQIVSWGSLMWTMEDNKLRLLTNKLPIMVGNIPVYSPLLIDLAEIGLGGYNEYMSICTIGVNALSEIPDEDIDDFMILMSFVLQQEGFYQKLLDALHFFTKLEFDIRNDEDTLCLFCGDIVLDTNNYNEFMSAIKFVTCVKDDVPEDELDEYDKIALEIEREIAEMQNNNKELPTLQDMISAICNMDGNGLSVLNVWDINVFSFYEQLKRGQAKEAYFLGFKQLLAGADSKEVELDYYMKKLD